MKKSIKIIASILLLSLKTIAQTADIGACNSLILCDSGRVMATGYNSYGELGNGGIGNAAYEPQYVNLLTDIIAVQGGWLNALALKNDGTVWAWGSNTYGQIGDSTFNDNVLTPVQVHGPGNVGFLSNIKAISAGVIHSLALKNDSTVWAWGDNSFGELGDSTNIARLVPIQVQGLTNVIAIAAGGGFSMALKDDGTV